jgi:hypothetical protein
MGNYLEIPVVEAHPSSQIAKAGYIDDPGSFPSCKDVGHKQISEQEMADVV